MVDILQVSGLEFPSLVPPPLLFSALLSPGDRWSRVPMSSLLPDMITTEAESLKETVQTSAGIAVIYA